ncbi:MAG: type II toxin-antitoxin system VapC family toxin [Phycisphaerales bacterium]|jgi:predicted nucleic acid-binding protein|nr:type II toxin-antitoxin system VapC family toxin [Phycisphaeraceae bacterium]
MTRCVLDCSLTMCWCFADEATPDRTELLRVLSAGAILVPKLWRIEVANVLCVAERRGRIDRRDAAAFLEMLTVLPIEDDASDAAAVNRALELARIAQLSVYDAMYLELAVRSGTPLATADRRLAAAAASLGCAILPNTGTT